MVSPTLESLLADKDLCSILEEYISPKEGVRLAIAALALFVSIIWPAPWLKEPRFESLRNERGL